MFASHSAWKNRIGFLIVALVAACIIAERLGLVPGLQPVTNLLYAWVILLVGVTLLLGITNVVRVHVERIRRGEPEWPLSLLLIAGLALVLLAGLIGPDGTRGALLEWTFDAIIAPGQATLFALTGIFVVTAAYRYLRMDRPDALWILAGATLVLLVQTPMTTALLPPVVLNLADWLLSWPVMAALRGAVLAGALAVLLVAVRLTIGSGR